MRKSLLFASLITIGLVSCAQGSYSQGNESFPSDASSFNEDPQNYRVEIRCRDCLIKNNDDADPSYLTTYIRMETEGDDLSFSIKPPLNPELSLPETIDFKCDTTSTPTYTYSPSNGSLSFPVAGNTTIDIIAGEVPCVTMVSSSISNVDVGFSYNGFLKKVDWGDGVIDQSTHHKYTGTAVDMEIKIYGKITSFALANDQGSLYDNSLSINEVKLGDSVTRIPDFAFLSCKELATFTFSNKLESLGQFAFAGTKITSVKLPKTVSYISLNAFKDTEFLETIEIDEDNPYYTSDYSDAVIDKSNMYLICGCKGSVISENVVGIGEGAFTNSSIDYIYMPSTLSYIGDYAFYRCHNLRTVCFPKSLTYIGHYAFAECTSIMQYDFSQCRNIPTAEDDSFAGASSNCYTVLPNNFPIDQNHIFEEQFGKRMYLCSELQNMYVWNYEQDDFSYTPCVSIIVDNSTATTQEELTVGFTYDTSKNIMITWGDGDKTGDATHSYAEPGRYIIDIFNLDKGSYGILDMCFAASTSALIQPGNVYITSIISRGYTFTSIARAFALLTNLSLLVFSNSKSFNDLSYGFATGILSGASGLKAVEIPDYISSFAGSTLLNCSSLKSVIFGKKLSSLGANCFGKTKIKRIKIPSLLARPIDNNNVGNYFLNISSLQCIQMEEGARTSLNFENVNNALIAKFEFMAKSAAFRFPVGAIFSASNSTVVPPNTTWVGAQAFAGLTEIETIDLPASCAGINSSAFNGATNLSTLVIRYPDAVVGNIAVAAFANTKIAKGEGYIYVPDILVEDYKTALSKYADAFKPLSEYQPA